MTGTDVKRRRTRQFNRLETTLIGGFLLIAGLMVGAWTIVSIGVPGDDLLPDEEAARLQAAYGPGRESQFIEEWIIRDFFKDRQGGFFVDVGASEYRRFSNTYFLETSLGWEGIAVEPLRRFEAEYLAHRPRTRFRPFFVSDVSNDHAKLFVIDSRTEVSSSQKSFTERWSKDATALDVPTITLDDLLRAERVTTIDFLSMDIELHEPQALAGFDVRQFSPELVCIEAHPEVRQAILSYFARNGYVVVGRYLRSDTRNLYFMPLPASGG